MRRSERDRVQRAQGSRLSVRGLGSRAGSSRRGVSPGPAERGATPGPRRLLLRRVAEASRESATRAAPCPPSTVTSREAYPGASRRSVHVSPAGTGSETGASPRSASPRQIRAPGGSTTRTTGPAADVGASEAAAKSDAAKSGVTKSAELGAEVDDLEISEDWLVDGFRNAHQPPTTVSAPRITATSVTGTARFGSSTSEPLALRALWPKALWPKALWLGAVSFDANNIACPEVASRPALVDDTLAWDRCTLERSTEDSRPGAPVARPA